MTEAMTDDEQPVPLRYAYKASVAGSPQSFELTGQGMSFRTGFRSGVWGYGDIARIRLTYRPVSMLKDRFRADIRHKDGRTLKIFSATFAGIIAMTPQNDSYRAFVAELHRRVAAERGGVECVAGLNPIAFALAVAIFGAIMLAIAALVVRALFSAEFVAALFLLGFAAWSTWYVGGWLTRNKPQRYAPQQIPPQLLP
jgi:hypothetical protein